MMDIKKEVGRKLRNLREMADLTQEQLAEEIGVQTNTISKVETGRHFISCEFLTKLCSYFKVDESYFFSFSTPKYNSSDSEKIEVINKKVKTLKPDTLNYIYKTILAVSE